MATPIKFPPSPIKRPYPFREETSNFFLKRKLENKTEEWNFLKLFNIALDYFAEISNTTDEDISTAISNIVSSLQIYGSGNFSQIDFKKAENTCGYLFRYSSLNAGLVRKRLIQASNSCNFLDFSPRRNEINVISLGGGPGDYIVGLCSALYEIKEFPCINIKVVESTRRWASCFNMIEVLLREDHFGNVSKLFQRSNVNTSFICCELTEDASTNGHYHKTLQEADIILMSEAWSIFSEEKKESFFNNIFTYMEEDTFLIYIGTENILPYFTDFIIVYHLGGEMYNFSTPIVKRFENETAVTSEAGITVLKRKTL